MKLALLTFRILAILNSVIACTLVVVSFQLENTAMLLFFAVLAGAWAYFMMRIRTGLIACQYWAWIAGIIVSGMSVLSLGFPFGIMGLVGLLNGKTRRAFNDADRLAGLTPPVVA